MTEYVRVDIRDARAGDEYLSHGFGDWLKIENVTIHKQNVALTFRNGGSTYSPISHGHVVRRAVA